MGCGGGGAADRRDRQDHPADRRAARRACCCLPAGQTGCHPRRRDRRSLPPAGWPGGSGPGTPIGSCPDYLPGGPPMARSHTAGPAITSPAAMTAASARAAGGASRSRRDTAGGAGCRPALPPAGLRRITPEDFSPAGDRQLSLAGMSRLGGTGPAPGGTAAGPPPPAGPGSMDAAGAARPESRGRRRLAVLPVGHQPVPGYERLAVAERLHRRRPPGPRPGRGCRPHRQAGRPAPLPVL